MTLDLKKIESRADRILKCYFENNKKEERIDIVKLASFFGFEIAEKDLPGIMESCMTVSEDSKIKNIAVNKYLSIETKRFAIAYELSYYFLYYQKDGKAFQHIKLDRKNDQDLDIKFLATSLLIPKQLFERQYSMLHRSHTLEETIYQLKTRYCVPQEVLEKKIKEQETSHKVFKLLK